MGFIAMERIQGIQPPGRVYVHTAGLQEVFGGIEAAREYANRYLKREEENHASTYQFMVVGVWGNKRGLKVLDLAGFSDMEPWPGNPDIDVWNVRNGLFIPGKTRICGDFSLVVGAEEEARRKSPSLDYFVKQTISEFFFKGHAIRIYG